MMRARFLWKPKNRYLTWVVSFFVAWYIVHAILGYPKVRDSSVPEFLPFPQQPLASLSTSPHSRPKVFVIGLSKTGTTSLGDALSRLSFRRVGWEDIRSRFLFRSYLNHDLTPLVSMTESYDAFEDLPWALVYQDMARLYSDAKFILTLRKNEQAWLKSITEHTARRKWIGHDLIYGASEAKDHEAVYLEAYRNHTSRVRSFFANAGNETRLLEWVIDGRDSKDEDEELWGMLLRFLNLEYSEEMMSELGDFPWSNRTESWKDSYVLKMVWQIWDRIMFYLEGVLLGVLQLRMRLTGGAIAHW
jgi:hypothetical protein